MSSINNSETTERRRPSREPRHAMPEQAAKVRAHNFDEVGLGYSDELAKAEAERCLQCKNPTCEQGCPVNVRIKDFIAGIITDDLPAGVAALKDRNALPAVCGRVCPQESQCEAACVLAKKGDPVAIGRLERYLADWDRALPAERRNRTKPHPKRVKVCCCRVRTVGACLCWRAIFAWLRRYRVRSVSHGRRRACLWNS